MQQGEDRARASLWDWMGDGSAPWAWWRLVVARGWRDFGHDVGKAPGVIRAMEVRGWGPSCWVARPAEERCTRLRGLEEGSSDEW